jgi:1-phosphofructokinase family hexose kinase
MIITITPNPAIDRTLTVPRVEAGAIHRATRSMVAAGGKGLNVARVVKQVGGDVVAMGLLGGYSGRWVAHLAQAEGIPGEWTYVEGETRTCTMVVSEEVGSMDTTVFNESGPTITHADWNQLIEDVVRYTPDHATVCICGSLPHGTPSSAPADLIHRLQTKGLSVWVDTSGTALRFALTASPFGIKINGREVGEVLGTSVTTVSEAVGAATTLREQGIEQVVITLGALGAVLVNKAGVYHAVPPSVPIVNTVGSGDAFFAGWLTALEQGLPAPEALRHAVAVGTANALAVGGGEIEIARFYQVLALTTLRV